MRSIKRVLANAALAGFSLALALALGEIAVRLLFKDATVLFPRYHQDYQYGKYTIRGIRPNTEFRHTSVDGSWTFGPLWIKLGFVAWATSFLLNVGVRLPLIRRLDRGTLEPFRTARFSRAGAGAGR